jgi:hypothetical protein
MMRFNLYLLTLALASGVGVSAFAFQPNLAVRNKLSVSPQQFLSQNTNTKNFESATSLWSTPPSSDGDSDESAKKKKSTAGFDEGLRSKLVSESIAPWRTVRLFFYASLGTGALIGGLVTLSGTAAALSGARPDLDLNEQVCTFCTGRGTGKLSGVLTSSAWHALQSHCSRS